jgi:hypothetical protein
MYTYIFPSKKKNYNIYIGTRELRGQGKGNKGIIMAYMGIYIYPHSSSSSSFSYARYKLSLWLALLFSQRALSGVHGLITTTKEKARRDVILLAFR